MEHHNSNKALILNFYTRVLGMCDTDVANSIIKDNYIQHNPMIKTGKNGFMEFLTFLKQLPQPRNPERPFKRLICDKDLVAVHLSINFMGSQRAVVDLYRIENGQIAEHWDASEEINRLNKNGNPVVEGETVIEDTQFTEENKLIVVGYNQQVLLKKGTNWETFVDKDLIQHNPDIENGLRALIHYYSAFEIKKVHRVLGEGNFVLTQSEGQINGLTYVIYDIYRLNNRKIAEHWSVKQIIPEKKAHANGMI